MNTHKIISRKVCNRSEIERRAILYFEVVEIAKFQLLLEKLGKKSCKRLKLRLTHTKRTGLHTNSFSNVPRRLIAFRLCQKTYPFK